MTLAELEAAIRAAGYRGNIVRAGEHALTFGQCAIVLLRGAERVGAYRRFWNLAVVATPGEVAEVMRAWGWVR